MTARAYATCPHRYTTLRNARRKAWDIADRTHRGIRPVQPAEPWHCDQCGGWHLATQTAPTTKDLT